MSTATTPYSIATVLETVTAARLAQLLANTARACPELGTRPEMAAGFILLGKISSDPDGDPGVFLVQGTADKPYRVDLAGDCECPDYSRRAPEIKGHRLCKHMLACVVVAYLRDREPQRRARRAEPRIARVATQRHRCARVHAAQRPRVRVPLVGRLSA